MADDRIEIEIVLDDGSIQKGFAKLNRKADQSAKKMGRSFGVSLTNAFKRITSSAFGALAGIGAAFAGLAGVREATRNLIEFQQRFEEIRTIIPNLAQANDQLNASLIETSQQFGTSAAEQARTFYQIISAGITDATAANKVLIASNKLAIGGLATQAEAVNILTSAINSFGAENLSAERAADILFAAVRVGKTRVDLLAASLGQILPAAKAIGVTFEDTAAAIATLTTRGLSTSEAVTQLNAVFTALLRKQALAKTFGPVVAKAFSLASLKAKGLTTFLSDLNKSVGGSGEALVKLLGRVEGVRAILTLSGDNFKALGRNVDALTNSAGAADQAFEKINLTLGQQLKVLSATFSGEVLKLSQNIEGPLVNSVRGLTKSITFLFRNIDAIIGLFKQLAITVTAFLLALSFGPGVFAAFSASMVGLVRNIRVIPLALQAASISFKAFAVNVKTVGLSLRLFPFRTIAFGFKRMATSINVTAIAMRGLKVAVNLLKISVTLGLILAFEFLIQKFLEVKDALGGLTNFFRFFGLAIKRSFAQAILSTSEFLQRLTEIPIIGRAIEKVFGSSIKGLGVAASIVLEQTNQDIDKLTQDILDARELIAKPIELPGPIPIPVGQGPLDPMVSSIDKSVDKMKQKIAQLNEAVRNGIARAMSSSIQAFVTALTNGENALEAFGKAFIGVIGDLAIQLGTMIVASGLAMLSLFQGNAAASISLGLGLIAIGSLLKALSGGGFEGAGVGPGNDAVTSPILGDDLTDSLRDQGARVQVTIEGNVFDTESTGLRIADILKEQGFNNAVIS